MATLQEHILKKSLQEAAPFSAQIRQYLETIKAVFSKLIEMVGEGEIDPSHKPYLKMKLKQVIEDPKKLSNPVQVAKLFLDLKVPTPVQEDSMGSRFLKTVADVFGMSQGARTSVKDTADKILHALGARGEGGVKILGIRVFLIALVLTFSGIFLNFFLKNQKIKGQVKTAIEQDVNPKMEVLIDAIVDGKINSQIGLNSYFAKIEDAVLFKYKDIVDKEPQLV